MTIHKMVHVKIRKGLGPAMISKFIEIFLDDVDDVCEAEIIYMIRSEVRSRVKSPHIIVEIHSI